MKKPYKFKMRRERIHEEEQKLEKAYENAQKARSARMGWSQVTGWGIVALDHIENLRRLSR